MRLDFEHPLLLLLVPACVALVVYVWRTSRAYMPPLRKRLSLGLRLAVVTLAVLVLASPQVQLRAEEIAVALLVDRSDSITPAARMEQERWLTQALGSKRLLDQAAVITFGETTSIESTLSTDPTLPRLSDTTDVGPSRSNLAAAIRAGIAALPPNVARRLVLLSDGRENVDSAEQAASLAAAANVQLVAVSIARGAAPEVLVRALDAPTQIREGDRFAVTAQIDATIPSFAMIHLLIDGRLVATQEVDLLSGSNRYVLGLEPLVPGQHLVRVQVEADSDTMVQNNSAGAVISVSGPARVLIVEGAAGEGHYLAEAIRSAGLNADLATLPAASLDLAALRSYDSVVMANVPANALAPGQFLSIRNYVQNHGGGLVVVGGESAYGPGSYARTPFEEMLPVRMDLRGRSVSASVALMLVIDASGSMGGGPGGATKMDLAKEAAIAAAELLGEYDQIGIVAFEDTARWILEPTMATDLGIIQSAISEMQPGGGTEIFPALRLAYDSLATLDARLKHIILLTDGQAPRGDYARLTQQMRESSVSLSTIAVGSDADFNLLQQLASMGNGRYYEGNDPFDLPRLVVKETQQVQRAAIVEEEFRPLRVTTSPALEGIDMSDLPLLRGYVATTPKPQSSVVLISRQLDPVLAEWQYGLGRVVAWTSDARNKWSSRWLEWPEFGRFWAQVIKRATRTPEDPNRQISVVAEGNRVRITLDAQEGIEVQERRYVNFRPTTAILVDPRGGAQQVPMPQIAPGRYQAVAPVDDEGVYALDVVQNEPDGTISQKSTGFVVPYSPEYRASGADETLLQTLARRTGGRLIREPDQAFTHDLPATGAPRPLWPFLLILTAILFVVDVGVRRIRVTEREMRTAYYAVRKRLGYVDDPEGQRLRVATATAAASTPAVSLVGGGVSLTGQATTQDMSRSSRLLAAKRRAARR